MGFALGRLGADWIPIEARYLRAAVDTTGEASLVLDGDPDLEERNLVDLRLDGVVWRVSEGDFHEYFNIFELISKRYPIVNHWQCTWLCSDKWRTAIHLAATGIPVVPTVLLTPGMTVPDFPGHKSIIKPSVGASGKGVRLAASGASPTLHGPHVAQPLVPGPSSAHIRVIVCGIQPIVSIHRIPGPEQAGKEIEVNNVAVGGKPIPAPMEPVHDLAVRVAQCLDSDFIGIDFVPWGNGFAVLEVNSSPGFNGILEGVGIDCAYPAAKRVIERLSQEGNNPTRPTPQRRAVETSTAAD